MDLKSFAQGTLTWCWMASCKIRGVLLYKVLLIPLELVLLRYVRGIYVSIWYGEQDTGTEVMWQRKSPIIIERKWGKFWSFCSKKEIMVNETMQKNHPSHCYGLNSSISTLASQGLPICHYKILCPSNMKDNMKWSISYIIALHLFNSNF